MRGAGKSSHLRQLIAEEAARLMIEHGLRDYRAAKRKAAQKLGAAGRGDLPSNLEIEQARAERLQIFDSSTQAARASAMRAVAREALSLLDRFRPFAVGAVVEGTADPHSLVSIHAFTEPAEEVGQLLDAEGIPARLGERRVRYPAQSERTLPAFRYLVADVPVEVVVFPFRARTQPPLSPVDGKPIRRIGLAQWGQLGPTDLVSDRG